MLELGMRVAFDKPIVVVKDDATDYSFDTSPIEHLTYPLTLHYPKIVEFKAKLADKVSATCGNFDASKSFLQQFGPIKVAQIEEVRVPAYELVREEIRELRAVMQTVLAQSTGTMSTIPPPDRSHGSVLVYGKKLPEHLIEEVYEKARRLSAVDKINISTSGQRMIIRVKPDKLSGYDQQEANDEVRDLLRGYLKMIRTPSPSLADE